jgi:hypothetical protein
MMMTTQSRHRAHAQMIQHKKFLQKKNQINFHFEKKKKKWKKYFSTKFFPFEPGYASVLCMCMCAALYPLDKEDGGDTMMMMRCGRPFVVFATV